jgi:hypothetical protein
MTRIDLTRRLCDVEAAFAFMHAGLGGATQVVTQLSLARLFNRAEFQEAVDRWVASVPLLRSAIEQVDGELLFRPAGRRAEQVMIKSVPQRFDLDEAMGAELNDPLPSFEQPWRLTVLLDPGSRRTHLFFSRTHAISDGASTAHLMRKLLEQLDAGPRAPEPDIDVGRVGPDIDTIEFEPPFMAPAAQASASSGCASADAIPLRSPANAADRRSSFLSWQLHAAQAAGFVDWAKRRDYTVNQFLAGALASATGQVLGRDAVNMMTAVSLRPWFPDAVSRSPGCTIGVVPSAVGIYTAPSATIESYRAGFLDVLPAWSPPRRAHSDIERQVLGLLHATQAPGVCITNVGAADQALGPHAPIIERYRTIVNRRAANYALVLHVGSLKGAFECALAFGTPSVDPCFAEAVRSRLSDHLTDPAQVR